jgi:hypothetical protein
MAHFKGQIIVPDFGFYGREAHTGLIREGRLIAGVNTLSEVPVELRKALLRMPNIIASRATYEDAETLAAYEGLIPRTIAHNGFIQECMA